jgi:hypothetical protein
MLILSLSHETIAPCTLHASRIKKGSAFSRASGGPKRKT